MLISAPICRVLMAALGCALPAYQTHKAVSSGNNEQLRHWCIYWLLMGFFLCLEWLADLAIFWLPLYYEAKLVFVVAMWHPRTHAAATIYDSYLLPFLRQHEATIDRVVAETRARIADTVSSQVNTVQGYLHNNADAVFKVLASVSEQKPRAGHEKAQ
ncbi:putative HVA22-like protein g [Tetrabaena socialis]|uniref:HVA22-like protein n=1 Tax=Tetrabaena socialis TaxID=47790 RepID=A0A2J8A3W2_9CHLO|nr:putative HVA22-like protein g [Tetrabaena socialis]|eukprot:PNH07209.1 putative HVA22-like protein g [Tetrabaena socialis]